MTSKALDLIDVLVLSKPLQLNTINLRVWEDVTYAKWFILKWMISSYLRDIEKGGLSYRCEANLDICHMTTIYLEFRALQSMLEHFQGNFRRPCWI